MKPKAANMALTTDEHSMIFSHHFGIAFRPTGQGSAPSNDYGMILTATVQISSAFLLAMAASCLSFPLSLFCWVAVGLILFFRFITFVLFLMAAFGGKYLKEFYRSSLFFWGWWPVFLLVSTAGAAVCGQQIGSYIETTCLGPYFELKKLQAYKGINPDYIPGSRIQDAGLVDFTEFVELDRAKGGCYMAQGNTYCVSPIVNGGEVKYGLAGSPRSGSYDYFAVGVNCCACPNRDFKCGEWNNPIASGGLRSLDEKSRPFFKLALDDWQASYQKTARNPMFFEWVQDAEWAWKGLWNRALHVGCLAAACGVSIALSVGFFLDKILQMLWQRDIVAPRSCFAPAHGFDRWTELLLPKMYYRYVQEQQEIAAMPVTAEWKPQRGPGSAKEDAQVAKHYGATGDADGDA